MQIPERPPRFVLREEVTAARLPEPAVRVLLVPKS
jgi:hypothetical protein